MKLTFIGLGTMGYPMAGHLKNAGYDVCVYNRTTQKAKQWVKEYAGHYAETPKQAAENANIVFICVGNDDDVREVVTGDQGVLHSLEASTCIVDHSTISSALAKELSEISAKQSIYFYDAPVSGGQLGAENGLLSIMVGGAESQYDAVANVMNSYAKSIIHMGESGAGQATKMVNQLLAVGVLQGMAEGFAMAENSGLSLEKVIEATSAGAAGSWQLANRGHNIANNKFDYGFAIDLMRKDLGICLNAAKDYNIPLPNAKWVDQCYKKLQEQGHSRSDTSVLVKQYDTES